MERAGRAHRGDELLQHQVRRGRLGYHPGIGRHRPAGVAAATSWRRAISGLYATAGDLTLKGANVSAYNVTLSAQRDLVMQSLALTDTSYSKSSSWSAFAGLAANASYGAEGLSVSYGINVSASDTTIAKPDRSR